MEESVRNMSLMDKVKVIDGLKKLKEAEIKEKESKLSKEIEELQEKRKKEIKALEDELKKEETDLDEEMIKALNEMFFRDRRRYLMHRARLERKAEFIDEASNSGHTLRGESFLYSISERIFAGENLKLREVTSFQAYSQIKDSIDRHYSSALSSQENGYSENLEYALGKLKEEYPYEYPSANTQNTYSSNKGTAFDRLSKDIDERRNYQ